MADLRLDSYFVPPLFLFLCDSLLLLETRRESRRKHHIHIHIRDGPMGSSSAPCFPLLFFWLILLVDRFDPPRPHQKVTGFNLKSYFSAEYLDKHPFYKVSTGPTYRVFHRADTPYKRISY
jgi:hypothetical protein